jgi:hypothetical protein
MKVFWKNIPHIFIGKKVPMFWPKNKFQNFLKKKVHDIFSEKSFNFKKKNSFQSFFGKKVSITWKKVWSFFRKKVFDLLSGKKVSITRKKIFKNSSIVFAGKKSSLYFFRGQKFLLQQKIILEFFSKKIISNLILRKKSFDFLPTK